MRRYMTTILLTVYNTGGIFLAIAFDVGECHEFYERFHVALRQFFDTNLSHYQLESDQDLALVSFEKRHRCHFIYLQHFLLNLKQDSSVSK